MTRHLASYIANLNQIPVDEPAAGEELKFGPDGHDLSLYTNSHFFDFDMGKSVSFDANEVPEGKGGEAAHGSLDFLNDINLDMAGLHDLNTVQTPILMDHDRPEDNGPSSNRGMIDTIPAPTSSLTQNIMSSFQSSEYSTPAHLGSAAGSPRSVQGSSSTSNKKRKSVDDDARAAAEEDKRRRNTAASARFRVKKKMREQAMETEARTLAEKVNSLEEKVRVLEMENRMLRGLVTRNQSN